MGGDEDDGCALSQSVSQSVSQSEMMDAPSCVSASVIQPAAIENSLVVKVLHPFIITSIV